MRDTPKLILRSENAAATTYSFVTDNEGGFRSWALCTVNDATGELLISSDWGSWSYRWPSSPQSLGAPNLTAFIGARDAVDYLARKLQSEGRTAYRFSPKATTAELRKLLVQRRLQDGRHQNDGWWYETEEGRPPPMDRYEADGRPIYSYRRQRQYEDGRPWDIHGRQYQRLPFLSKETARRLWNELGELAEDLHGTFGGEHVYWERLQRIDGFDDYVTDAPYEHVGTEQTFEDRILRGTILPALIAACAATTSRRLAGEQPPPPPEAQV
jgi:hypothetical protein